MAGITYWFPKAFGFTLDEALGKAVFWCWFVGFYLAFMPLYVLGFLGMTRRMNHYDNPAWDPWILVAGAGAFLILALPPDGEGPRAFECFGCDQPDPMKTEKVTGWLMGELQPLKR